jgi:hypothetical protein
MQRIGRIAALLLASVALVLLALAYLAGAPTAPVPAVAVAAPHPPAGQLHLRMSLALSAPTTTGNAVPSPIAPPSAGVRPALLLASALLAAFGVAFWLGSLARRHAARGSQAQLAALRERVEPRFDASAANSPALMARAEMAPADAQALAAERAAADRLAEALEARELEVQLLQQEIADWQDAWRMAKPRLAEQGETIERMETELAAARSTVAGLRRYVNELQRQRGTDSDSRFSDDVDAWIARFLKPASNA